MNIRIVVCNFVLPCTILLSPTVEADFCTSTPNKIIQRFPSLEKIWNAKIKAMEENEIDYKRAESRLKESYENGGITDMEYAYQDTVIMDNWGQTDLRYEMIYMEKFKQECQALLITNDL